MRSVLERKVEEKEHFNANIIRGSPDIGNIFINYPGPGTAGKEGISNTNLFFYTNLVENSACIIIIIVYCNLECGRLATTVGPYPEGNSLAMSLKIYEQCFIAAARLWTHFNHISDYTL